MLNLRSNFRQWLNKWSATFREEFIKALIVAIISGLTLLVGYLVPFARSVLQTAIQVSILSLAIGLIISIIVGGILTYFLLEPRIKKFLTLVGTDELTGLYNSRELKRRLENEINRADRSRRPLSIILIDLDGFKTVNDSYGYEAGDVVLQEFAQLLKSELRDTDIPFRYKLGDEFIVLLPDTSLLKARIPAERLRGRIERYQFNPPDKRSSVHITISAGVVILNLSEDRIEGIPKQGRNIQNILKPAIEKILKRAEDILAEAKITKNSVVMEEKSYRN